MEASTEISTENFTPFETFENFDETQEFDSSFDEDWSKPLPEEKISEDLKVIKESSTDIEGKVIKEDEEKEKEKKKEVKEKKEETENEIEEEEKKTEDEEIEEKDEEIEEKKNKEAKKLIMKMGDELFNVSSDATFKVKVDGKTEKVPLQELISNYSGKTAWDRKFRELGKEKKYLETSFEKLNQDREYLLENINKIMTPLKMETGNPLDSILNLVEMSGEDPYNAYRRMMEANLEELEKLLDMNDVERELYFHKKKDELHSKINEKRSIKLQEEKELSSVTEYVDKLRNSHNVSESQFVEASDELEELYRDAGLDDTNLTAEVVVDYASLKPHIAQVKELIAPYEENISEENYGDLVASLSRKLRDRETTVKRLQELIHSTYSIDEEVKELNSKVYNKGTTTKKAKIEQAPSSTFETFEDF